MMRFRRFLLNLRRFLAYKQNLLATLIIGSYVLIAVAAPTLAPPDPRTANCYGPINIKGTDLASRYLPQPPNSAFPFGTTPLRNNQLQLNVFCSLVWGTRSALQFGLVVVLMAAGIGVLIGAPSAYLGGWVNGLAMRFTDAFLTLPTAIGVALLTIIMYQPNPNGIPTPFQEFLIAQGITPTLVALIVFSWMPYARLINANVAQLKCADFVLAARAIGARNRRIVFRHLLPNALVPLIVLAARDIGGVVILDSTFAYIGIGGTTPWGGMLFTSREWIIGVRGNPLTYWWVWLPAATVLLLFSIGWNLLGDGLTDMLNPRLKR